MGIESKVFVFSPVEVLPMSSSLPPSASLSNVSRKKEFFFFNFEVILHFLEYRNVSANSEKEGWPLTWRIVMQCFSGVFGQLTILLPGGRASWSSPPGALPPSAPARPPATRWQFKPCQHNARPWKCQGGQWFTYVDWSPPPPWR